MSNQQERESVIRARGVTKTYKDFAAVDGIDFDIYRGTPCLHNCEAKALFMR